MQRKLKIVSTSYSKTAEYTNPQQWLERISFYTGLLKELAKRHEVTSIERISYDGELDEDGVHYRFIDLKKKVTRYPWQMHSYIKRQEPDVVFVNGLAFPLQVIQLRFSLGKKVKIILLHRAEKPFTGIKRRLQRLADKYVDAYLFVSAEFANQWKNNISTEKIQEVVQASSIFQYRDKQKAKELLQIKASPVFLWVGRLDANKNPVMVVKAFQQFVLQQPTAKLYMIYQSEELLEKIKTITAEASGIKLIGKVEHRNLQNWYSCADFIISGSYYEGSGISVLEAMSCGCIPVVTNILSFRRMTGPDKCGLLYEAGSEKELLAGLMKTKELDIKKERVKVLQQFNEALSFEAIAGKIEKLITSLNAMNDD